MSLMAINPKGINTWIGATLVSISLAAQADSVTSAGVPKVLLLHYFLAMLFMEWLLSL